MERVRRRILLMLAALAVPVAVAACGDEAPLGPEEVEYHPSLGVGLDQMTKLPTGVYVQTLEAGEGTRTLAVGDSAQIGYTLWLPSGKKVQEGQFPVLFEPGALIPGFSDGIMGMKEGEVRLIVVPPEQGYGASPPVGIPPNSVLVFKAELLDFLDDEEGSPGP